MGDYKDQIKKSIYDFRKLWSVILQHKQKNVYLLDPEDTSLTRTFAREFQFFVDPRIKFIEVKYCSECRSDYPIALLSIRHTDRVSEDIQSILSHLREEYKMRTVLIYIHVRQDKDLLPRIATKVKVSEFCNVLGDIVDFGLVKGSIKTCFYDGMRDSNEAFQNFVLNGKADCTSKTSYNSFS